MRLLPPAAFLLLVPALAFAQSAAAAQDAAAVSSQDSDRDGLSDALEDALLAQFAPRFMVNADDCAGLPAAFVPFNANPAVQREDGTIYGQAFPQAQNAAAVELHYFHLWKSDCGEMSHNRDAEHVAVLVTHGNSSEWKALYWYAAAHEDTVCDASQIARAASVDGQLHGPRVWISRGKHASFLSEAICRGGCGGDVCTEMKPLGTANIINMGELTAPMNGAIWAASPVWPLATKMARSDFSDARLARLDGAGVQGIVHANPDNKKMKAVILGSGNALEGAATGMQATDAALNTADVHTSNALNTATDSTSGSLEKSYRSVKKALGLSIRKVGNALDQK
jgi:hypothetical protein